MGYMGLPEREKKWCNGHDDSPVGHAWFDDGTYVDIENPSDFVRDGRWIWFVQL